VEIRNSGRHANSESGQKRRDQQYHLDQSRQQALTELEKLNVVTDGSRQQKCTGAIRRAGNGKSEWNASSRGVPTRVQNNKSGGSHASTGCCQNGRPHPKVEATPSK